MPFVTVDHLAGIGPEVRRELQERLAAAVVEALSVSPSAVRVITRAYDPADVYVADGQHSKGMPMIWLNLLAGRTEAQKKAALGLLARGAADVLKVPVMQIRAILNEMPHDTLARGELTVDERAKLQ